MLASRIDLHKHCPSRKEPCSRVLHLYLLFPLGSTWVAAKRRVSRDHFSFHQWGLEINQIKREHAFTWDSSFPPFFLIFILFAPMGAIHRITGSRNNNPQVNLRWKVVCCSLKYGQASAFLYLNEERGSNMRRVGGSALRLFSLNYKVRPSFWYTFQMCLYRL